MIPWRRKSNFFVSHLARTRVLEMRTLAFPLEIDLSLQFTATVLPRVSPSLLSKCDRQLRGKLHVLISAATFCEGATR